MERSNKSSSFIIFFFFVVIVLTVHGKVSIPDQSLAPRPMCVSQYALANYACSLIPYSPLPPPTPSATLEDEEGDGEEEEEQPPSRHRHHHHHHHNHQVRHRQQSHNGTPEEQDCCRWLEEMDSDCVCEMLVRLPDFLSRPVHEYSIYVGDMCNVTYTCSGRVIRK